ncbi:MAG TPA: hypothetical protein V6D33_06135 [Cyanophyceae cyanobacterium]
MNDIWKLLADDGLTVDELINVYRFIVGIQITTRIGIQSVAFFSLFTPTKLVNGKI